MENKANSDTKRISFSLELGDVTKISDDVLVEREVAIDTPGNNIDRTVVRKGENQIDLRELQISFPALQAEGYLRNRSNSEHSSDEIQVPDHFFIDKKKVSRHMSKKDIVKQNIKVLKKISEAKMANYDAEANINIKYFEDARPKDKIYFQPSKYYGKQENGIAVVIPFFNEEKYSLVQTLNSLYNAWNHLNVGSKKWRSSVLYVCLIQDGWNRASASMKEYLKELFPKKIIDQGESKYWWEYYQDFCCSETEQSKLPDRTYIFEKGRYGHVAINPFIKDKKFMRITLVIKTKNRRKHNSHEWFFGKNGFAEAVNAKYLMLTDAFAMYNSWLLYHLAKELDKHDNLVAITGRQRLMSRSQQGSQVGMVSLGNMLSLVQLYDFESSNVIYNGAFSLGGLLPVIPGPCGLYRASNLLDDDVRNYYFETVNKDPDQTGMVLGNLRIAEDRIISYASVMKSKNPSAYMKFHPLVIFYFEAETSLKNLIFQRRRWINGSVAGYLFLLFFNFTDDFLAWKAGTLRKFYIWTLLMCQFFTYMMVGLAPAVSLRILYHGISYFLSYYNIYLSFDIIIIGIICWSIYLIHVIYHHSRSKFNYIIIYTLLLLSFTTSLVSAASLLHYTFVYSQLTLADVLLSGNIVIYLGLYVLFGPFIVSLLLSGRGHSFLFMLKAFPSYFLFLPMFIAWFGSYSYCRTWDLSWGNRPASEMDAVSEQKKEEVMRKFKNTSRKIIAVLIVLNILLFLIPLQGQIILMSIFFGVAAYQLTLSIIFCLTNLFIKIIFIFKKLRISCSKKIANEEVRSDINSGVSV